MSKSRFERLGRLDLAILVYAVFVAGLCSIVYELLIATVVSYFEGDPITYFSTTIGIYMAAMGIGAYCSKFITTRIISFFVISELLLATVGGLSVPLLYIYFANGDWFFVIYFSLTFFIGVLIGLEIPLLTRIMGRYSGLRETIASVLSLDYLGALVASIAFPLILLPWLGLLASGVLIGAINSTIAIVVAWRFRKQLHKLRNILMALGGGLAVALVGLLFTSDVLLNLWRQDVYDGRILHAERSFYQEIVLTTFRGDLRLYLDGNLQFSSDDEYRYHEALVHTPVSLLERSPTNVLVLGGGDGLVLRELLKHSDVKSITLVELDPAVLSLGQMNSRIKELNRDAFSDPRVKVIIADAFKVLEKRSKMYDLIIADLPDPNNAALARLYTRDFYSIVRLALAPGGLFVTQATSPYYAERAFRAMRAAIGIEFKETAAYHLWLPSFGDWGFIIAGSMPINPAKADPNRLKGLRFLTTKTLSSLFVFPPPADNLPPVEIATLDRPVILSYYLEGWKKWRN
ncbi:polyamine aminopropyltransferase [Alphaproteobacteria bacterium]|nr:polyamine aminopropyltransferase [Alphaproteobacteria bacterium]